MSGCVLVTGATGFVGRNLVASLLNRGRTVVGFSSSLPGGIAPPVLPASATAFTEIQGDIRDRAGLTEAMRTHGVGDIVHLAAMTPGADEERALAQTVIDVNVGGTASVMQAAMDAGVSRIVLASSVAVYGSGHPDGSRLDEDLPPDPQSLYAISKRAAERVAMRLGPACGLDWRIGRLGRVFGPFEYETGVRATMSQIFLATRAARDGRAVRFSRPCRKAWHYAPDAAEALAMLLDAPDPVSRLFNLGARDVWALSDWCALLSRTFPGFGFHVGDAGRPDDALLEIDLNGHTDGGNLSFDRFEREIGPMPGRTLDEAFADYVSAGPATPSGKAPA